jgi:HEPN domain-containing protein
MNLLTREWVTKAEADYAAATYLLARRGLALSDVICFHCQQCAEKYLKGLLQEHGIAFSKTHDLMKLLGLILPVQPTLKKHARRLKPLTDFAVDFRYPGTAATRRQAVRTVAFIEELRIEVRSRLGIVLRRPRKRKP